MKDSHLQELKTSLISDEIIALNFRSLTGDNIYEYLAVGCTKRLNSGRLPASWTKLYSHCKQGGWWANGVNLENTSQELEWGCFKPEVPRLDEYGLKPIKYEHPKGIPTNLFAFQVGSDTCEKINKLYQKEFTPDNFWGQVLGDLSIPVIITEGSKKAACLLSAGFIAIGLPGIWGGYRKELKETNGLIPPLVALGSREILFAFDQDAKPATRKAVKSAMNATGNALKKIGATPHLLVWPDDYKGVDDLIAAKGTDYFLSIFVKSQKTVEVITSTPLMPPSEYQEQEKQLPDQKIDPDQTPEIQAVLAVYGNKPHIALGDDLFFWNGKYYEKCKPGREKQRLKYWAENTPVFDPKTQKETYKYLTCDWINRFWRMALLHFAVDPDLINPPGLNLANGVLKITITGKSASWKMVEHSPKNYFLYSSEVKFNEKADPKSCNDLLLCLDEAPRTAFLRQVAASLDLESVRKVRGRDIRAAICLGSGANGKDSLNEAIAAIFTDNQMCSAGFNQFIAYDNGRQFTLAKLRGSKINWASENNKDNSLDHSQSLNIAITGDRGLEYERKGKDAEPFIAQCIHFFSCNQLPKMKSGLDSLMSRFAVYQFNKTFSMTPNPARGELQADPRFKYDRDFVITQVAPALLNTILDELKKLLIEGIDYDAIKSSMDDIQEESTHLWGFCHDYALSANPDKGVYINDLWEYLKSWYIETGTLEIEEMSDGKRRNIWHEQANSFDKNITGANQVYKRLKTLFPKISKHRDTRDGENVGKFYIWGLELQNYASVLQSPCKSRVSASVLPQSASVSSPEGEQGKNEAKNKQTEAESTLDQQTEALKQTDHIQYSPDPNRRENLLETIFIWVSGLEWSQNQLKAFAKEKIGLDSSKDMTEAQLFNLGQLLSKEIPLKAKKSEF